jgi:hypothetical protein
MSIILAIHIITFSTSILLTTTSLLQAVLGHSIPQGLVRTNAFITACGVMSGVALLYSSPLGLQCALLFGYVIAFALISAYVARRNKQLAPAS